jgi:hypothetical protein
MEYRQVVEQLSLVTLAPFPIDVEAVLGSSNSNGDAAS